MIENGQKMSKFIKKIKEHQFKENLKISNLWTNAL